MALNRDVKVTLVGEDHASKTFDKVGKSSGGLAGKLGGLTAAVPVAGAVVGGLAVGAMKLAGSFIETSSRLEALGRKSQTVFGDQLGTVKTWAKTNAGAMKLTSSEAVGLATNMADLLIPMGFTRKAAADMSTKTIGLAGALSKWSGGAVSSADAADILTSAYLGETDGLKALGISISAAEVDARLLKNGQDKLTGAALAQAQAQATQALIFEKSRDAQAAFAAGGDTLAGKLEGLKVKLRGAAEALVVQLTPAAERFADWIATDGVAKLQQFGTWLSKNKQNFIDVAVASLRGVSVISGALATLVQVATFSYGAILKAAVFAFGWIPGVGDKLRGAQTAFAAMRDTAVASLKAASSGADTLADKLAGIKSKEITVTVRERYIASAALRDAAVERRGIGVPAAARTGVTPGRTARSIGSTTNVIIGGKTVASVVEKRQAGRAARGARVLAVP